MLRFLLFPLCDMLFADTLYSLSTSFCSTILFLSRPSRSSGKLRASSSIKPRVLDLNFA